MVLQDVLLQKFLLLISTSFAMGTMKLALSGASSLMSFDVNFQHHFVLKLFATDITNVGWRSAVLILVVLFLVVLFQIWEVSVAMSAVCVFSVFQENMFRQSLLPIKLFITMLTSMVCLDIWVVFPFVLVDAENVTIQASAAVAFCFTVGTLLCIEDAFYPCRQTFLGMLVFSVYPQMSLRPEFGIAELTSPFDG